ncbi:hypothetical protein RND81_04G154500 [Saponaria officinalis]|uniref:Histone deacetylase domain-containing protein n=1 Tax=Saponaria officinalis TaxID=3572 RepID=A0AAW1LL84_SAPOF
MVIFKRLCRTDCLSHFLMPIDMYTDFFLPNLSMEDQHRAENQQSVLIKAVSLDSGRNYTFQFEKQTVGLRTTVRHCLKNWVSYVQHHNIEEGSEILFGWDRSGYLMLKILGHNRMIWVLRFLEKYVPRRTGTRTRRVELYNSRHFLDSKREKIHVFWEDRMLKYIPSWGVFDDSFDPGFLDVLEPHPENPYRVSNMVSILKRGPISPYIKWHSGAFASTSELLSFHSPEYIKELEDADKSGGKMMCIGTYLNPASWEAARLAAGTTLTAMKHVLEGKVKIAYALVRPPGHHARRTQADGYCFLNNAGLAVQLALKSGRAKVAVIDIDAHHGSGMAEFFYHSSQVLTISIHMNHSSSNGTIDEVGEGDGFGFNMNVPLPHGSGDRGYLYAMKELVVPAVEKFQPDMIVFAIGQDSSAFDPNGRQCVTMDGYREMGRIIRRMADSYCKSQVLMVQEGGYQVTYSAFCLHATLEGVLDLPNQLLPDPIAYYPEEKAYTVTSVDSMKKYFFHTTPN